MRLSLRILGSGGPIANATRASSGYLVCVDDVPRVLVDAGGGIYERIGRAGIDLSQLEVALLSHTHIDHTGGLAPVVFHAYMNDRKRPLSIVGPAGREMHPGCVRFTDLLFGVDGAWSYLHTFDGFAVDAREMPSDPKDARVRDVLLPTSTLANVGISIRSVAVPHGMMPSIAYRVTCGALSIAFSGDVENASPALASLARDADLLVHDLALPERDVPHGNLHAKPSAVGAVARDASVRSLLVSHFMPAIEPELADALAIVRGVYAGPVFVAEDLASYDIDASGTRLR
jgi:ribonuclease BN (tRNA processing enzyme)